MLRELNRLDDAMQQYDDTIAQFRDDVVAFRRRAEVLHELNRLDEALLQDEDTIDRFRDSVVAYCGRAEVLRELNRLDEALQQYDDTIARFPDDVVACCGRAVVLMELRRLNEALSSALQAVQSFPTNWIAKHILGMVYLRTEDFDTASQIFEAGASSCRQSKHRRYFLNGLAAARLRQQKAAEAIKIVEDIQSPVADVIRMHAFGQQNNALRCHESFARIAQLRTKQIASPRDLLYAGYLGPNAEATRTAAWQSNLFRAEEELLLRFAA